MIGARYVDALNLASHAHGGQKRKGTEVDYISHPIAVSALVMEFGGDEDQAIIALCHDMVEDCGRQWEASLAQMFGDPVAAGVMHCTDDAPAVGEPKRPWRERKEAYIRHLYGVPYRVLLVILCDKLHNARAIVADIEESGERAFGKFAGGPDGTRWYYGSLLHVFEARQSELPVRAVSQFKATVAQILDRHERMTAFRV